AFRSKRITRGYGNDGQVCAGRRIIGAHYRNANGSGPSGRPLVIGGACGQGVGAGNGVRPFHGKGDWLSGWRGLDESDQSFADLVLVGEKFYEGGISVGIGGYGLDINFCRRDKGGAVGG